MLLQKSGVAGLVEMTIEDFQLSHLAQERVEAFSAPEGPKQHQEPGGDADAKTKTDQGLLKMFQYRCICQLVDTKVTDIREIGMSWERRQPMGREAPSW